MENAKMYHEGGEQEVNLTGFRMIVGKTKNYCL
jgi:hypothetical protein